MSPSGDGVPSQTCVVRVTHVRPCGEGDPCQYFLCPLSARLVKLVRVNLYGDGVPCQPVC